MSATLLLEKVVGNGKDINLELGALSKEVEVVEKLRAIADSVASGLVLNSVTAGNLHVVTASVVGLFDSDLVDGRVTLDLRRGHGGSGHESDDGVELHLEVLKVKDLKD